MGNAVKTKQYPVKKSSRSSTSMPPGAEELKQSLKRLETLRDAAPIGICHTDLTGKFTYVNKRFEKVSGYSREEVVGKNGFKLGMFSSQTLKLLRERIKDKLMGRPSRVLELQFKCKDGHWIWIAMEGQLIQERGIPIGFQLISSDITEHRRAEEELLKSEERSRSIVENSHDGIMILDDAYRLIYVNDELCRISGYSRKEAIGQDFRKFLDEESQQLVTERYLQRQRGEEVPPRYEFNIVRKDGQKRRVETSSSVIKDSAGRVKTVAQILDITERKQAEETLQAEKNKLQSVIDAMEYGLSIQEKDYNIIYQSELLRITFGDHLGEKCYRAYESREKVCDGCPVEKAFRDGKSHTSERRRVVMPSGEVTFSENTASPIRDARGRIVSCLEIVRDITKRKQAEEALRQSREKLQKMFESVTDGILVIDLNGIITEVNQRMVEMHGFNSKDELLGKSAIELVAPRDHERAANNMRQAIKRGAITDVEYTLLRADGSEFPGELSTSMLRDTSGKVVGHITIARDITERKWMEMEYKTITQTAIDGFWLLDMQGHFLDVNDAYCRLIGYNHDELLKMSISDVEEIEKLEETATRIAKIMGVGGDRFETRHRCKDGKILDVEISVNYIQVAGGRMFVFIRDITERKRMEEALVDEATRRRILVDQSSDGIVILDQNGNVYETNQRFAEMLGYSPEEAAQLHVWDWDTQWPREKLLEMVRSVDAAGDHFETYHRRKDGTVLDVEISTNGAMCAGQKLVFCVCRDITERKRAEEAFKLQAAYFKQLFDSSPDAISWLDTADRFVNVNKGFETLFGYRIEETKGRFINELIIPEDRTKEALALYRASINGKVTRKETVRKRKDGSLVDVSVLGYPIRFDNKIVGRYIIYSDITERKRAEEERRKLEAKAHLTSRLASVGEMATGIAHEINNPLTAVIGFAQLLMDANIPDDVKEDIAIIYKEAQRAAEVAKSLLVFARKHEPAREPTDINHAIEEMLKLRAYEQRVNNIQVNTRFDPELPTAIADYSQLQQVFLNIIINAESAMLQAHNGGILTITTQKANGTIKISFTDNGPGIAKENLERVFDPFFTTKEVGKGTGLGLSVCHGIVVQHGGRIYARSRLGKGATFVVELPINAQ